MAANDSDNSASENRVPALIAGPKGSSEAEVFGPVIDLKVADTEAHSAGEPAEDFTEAQPEAGGRGWHFLPHAPLAAILALSLSAGGLAGAAATAVFMRDSGPAPTVAASEATRALQDSVTQLGTELAMLKTGVVTAQKTASLQIGKIADRLDRAEKSQAEPANKLTKLQESIDRLEHRQQAAAEPSDVTGSIKPKEDAKAPVAPMPQVAEGWRLRDFFDGHAIIEGRNGTLFRVGPGSQVPGLGKVEAIKRDNGKTVVVTTSGIITAALEPRRPSFVPRW